MSYGPLFNQSELLITSRQGFQMLSDADVHLRGCVSRLSMYKLFLFCSDLLNMSRTGVLKRTQLHHLSKRVSSGLLDTNEKEPTHNSSSF